MQDDDSGLSVGFEIDFRDSFGRLRTLDDMVGDAAAQMFRQMQSMEKSLGMPISAIRNLTQETRQFTRDRNAAERAGEGLSRQLDREAAAFGKSRDEMRAAKVEAAALAAEQRGLIELAGRLRSQEQALSAQKAQAIAARQAEADATARAAREHAELANRIRASHAAQEADAVAAERLRMATDPLYAATQRLNAEIAESTRLYHVGATGAAEYARQQDVLSGRLREVEQMHGVVNRSMGTVGANGKLAGHHMQNLAFQFQDLSLGMGSALASSEPMKMMLMTLAQQGMQIQGIMMQAGVGVRGLGSAIGGSALSAARAHPVLLGVAAAAGAVAAAIGMIGDSARDRAAMESYASSIGVSAEEMKKLDDVTITFGDTAKAVFQVAGRAIWDQIGPAVSGIWDSMKEWISWIGSGVKSAVNFLIGGFVGAYNVITKSWSSFPAVIGDIFYGSVNAAISAINTLIRRTVDGLNLFISTANILLGKAGLELPMLTAPQIEQVNNQYAGAYQKFGETARAEMEKAMGVDYLGNLGSAIMDQAADNARQRIRKQADEKGFLDPEKGATKAKGLSDAEKAYQAAVKAAREYAAAQLDEAAKVGLTAKQLRLYADAAAMAKAPTVELKKAIEDAAAVREKAYSAQDAKDFDKNVMQPLRDELALYGLVGPARDAAALALEKQAFLAEHMDDGIEVATARWKEYFRIKSELIARDATAEREAAALAHMVDLWDAIARNVQIAGQGMADAFGRAGAALGGLASIFADFNAERARADAEHIQRMREAATAEAKSNEVARHQLSTSTMQLGLYGDMASAAKGFFKEKSAGWKAVMAAEKVFRAFEFAMSVRAMVQDIAETTTSVANSAARATAAGTEGIANQSKLPFPFNIAAMAATGAALLAAGIAVIGGRGGGNSLPQSNTGTGTVLGDGSAQSESIKNAIDALRDVDTLMLSYSRQMAASLRSIESQIGGFASLLVRQGDSINASGGITEGFNANIIGSVLGKIPLIGGILKGLFGTKTTVIGSGLYGGAQSLGDILGGGFDASYYSDVQKKKKFLGLTTSTKYSTTYTGADPMLENQFTLILKSFNDAILAAAGPLGAATSDIQQRLNGFVLNIGKIDLKGLTGAQIEEKLNAVFGAAADNMARAAFPFIDQFQKVGEGAFETLVRVASTVEAVTASFDMLGRTTSGMGIEVKMAIADQFDSIGALTSATQSYFEAFYTREEQAAARAAQMTKVFESLGLSMPSTLAGFRALVEAQDLNTAAGREAYALLLQLAPAFADLQAAMAGAKSAADIASERQDLERQLLELRGDTAALRALQLAKLDASNRALQQEIWAMQDAQAAAKAADELRKAWQSVSDSIMDEVRRIRGLTAEGEAGSLAALMARFNAATTGARGGDIEAAKSLPQLSQALLAAAQDQARSRAELDRIRAQIAASLELTNGLIAPPASNTSLLDAAAASQPANGAANSTAANSTADSVDELREETKRLRADLTAALATIAANTGRAAKKLDDVTAQSGGDAISTVPAA